MSAPLTKLGAVLRDLKAETGKSLKELTVLSPQKDPFRLDTPAFHEAGRWFRDQMDACGLLHRSRPIHNRGAHYAIFSRGGVRLPSGAPYLNDDHCWQFLEDSASKAARWLGYVPFEAIADARNSAPVTRIVSGPPGPATASVYSDAWRMTNELPDATDLRPSPLLMGSETRQPYRIVFFGEKTSLEDVLGPMAEAYGADLYLPSGEISDTMLATMARTGAADYREMVVLVFADCDPAGYQMATSIGHKLRALAEALYPSLRFRVVAPALTVEQVRELGLPSTPLKPTELRAEGWREKYGVEQTEIDALATLQPNVLKRIVRDAVAPYYDFKLSSRYRDSKSEWYAAAEAALEAQADLGPLGKLKAEIKHDLDAVRTKLNSYDAAVDEIRVDLPPPPPVPEPDLPEPPPPLVSSDMPLVDHIAALRARKDYAGGAS